jgi:transcriptional regulator with XRE-family HTH domain
MPYRLTEQPEPIDKVLTHLGYDVRMARYGQFETQPRLSLRAGIGQSTWSMVENGLAEGIRLETLARIAVALGGELVLAQCRHPPGIDDPSIVGRPRRLIAATRLPGRGTLRPGPG